MKTHKRHLKRQAKQAANATQQRQQGSASTKPMGRGPSPVCADEACYAPTNEFALGRQWSVIPD